MKYSPRTGLPNLSARLLCVFFVASGIAVEARSQTQSISLEAGWNSVYLEVAPGQIVNGVFEAATPATVFGGNEAIEQVSGYFPRLTSAQFTETDTGIDFGKVGWLTWRKDEPLFSSLGKVLAHHSYLIKAREATTVSVSGELRFESIEWVPNAFNFLGFQVDADSPPTFDQFVAGEPAIDASQIFQLDDGVWEEVSGSASIRPGEAYWILCGSGTEHQGPLEVDIPGGDRLNFGKTADSFVIDLRNTSDGPIGPMVEATGSLVLEYEVQDTGSGTSQWIPLGSGGAGLGALGLDETSMIRIRVDRTQLVGIQSSIVTVRANGMLFRIPVSAESKGTRTGLWVGNVALGKVSQISRQGAGAKGPTRAGGEFNMRIILHGGAGDTVQLLKEVYLMREKGELAEGDSGHVLVTDELQLHKYDGIVPRGNTLIPQRISTPFYEFPGKTVSLSGVLDVGGTVQGAIGLPEDHPSNPFRHRYHPDHVRGKEIVREISITLDPEGGEDASPDSMRGTYRETIYGLAHSRKGDVTLEGTVELRRVSEVPTLN